MSRLPRLAFTTSAAALALLLVAPSAALADDHGKAGDQGKSADSRDGHNPPGNNGTIKIDYPAPADSGHANRPHPGCAFQLRMFNFDDDQYGTITFVGQAPTKLGTLLTQSHVLLSDDAAGGGQDTDAVYSYTADQLGLTGTPQAKQGWHIKVSVDADDAPGGAKQKVFWLSCPATTTPATTTPATTTGATSGAATGAATGAAATVVTTKSVPTTAQSSAAAEAVTASAGRTGLVKAAGRSESVTTFTGGGGTAAVTAAARPTRVTRGSALPFTGFALGTAVLLALAFLTAGVLAVRAGRRRTTTEV